MIDESTGEITGYKTTIGGADTVFPFSGVCPPLLQVKTWGAGDGSYHYAELKYDVSNASKLHIGTVTSSALNYLYFAVKNGSTVIWEQNSNSEATDVTIDISAYDEIILFSQTRWGAITYAQDISWE